MYFPETDSAFIVVDAFDKGSYIKIVPGDNKIIGYSTRNSGGVPNNFKNYFVIQFNKPFTLNYTWHDSVLAKDKLEITGNHAGAVVGFKTRRHEKYKSKLHLHLLVLNKRI